MHPWVMPDPADLQNATENEYNHLYEHDVIKLTNVDIALQAGYRNLYQHIHLHQQATDAINFKITSCLLLSTNDKIDNSWKKEYLGKNLYLAAMAIKVDEPRTRNLLHPYRRESSQHPEFELNQPTSVPPLHVHSVGHQLIVIKGPTGPNIFDKVNNPAIISSHLFDQTSISGPLNSNSHSLISLCARKTIWSKARRHIHPYLLPAHDERREMAGGAYIDVEDNWKDIIRLGYIYADNQHHALQRSYHHHQVQRRHGHRLTSEAHQDPNEPVSIHIADI